jgi:hypothetical protein
MSFDLDVWLGLVNLIWKLIMRSYKNSLSRFTFKPFQEFVSQINHVHIAPISRFKLPYLLFSKIIRGSIFYPIIFTFTSEF